MSGGEPKTVRGEAAALLGAATRAFVAPGERVAVAVPTWEPALAAILAAGRRYVDVGRRWDLSVDLDGLRFVLAEAEGGPPCRLAYLDAPGWAAGSPIAVDTLDRLARGYDAVVIVDRRFGPLPDSGDGADGGAGVAGRLLVLQRDARGAALCGARELVATVTSALEPEGAGADSRESEHCVEGLRRHARSLARELRRVPGLDVPRSAAGHVFVRAPGVSGAALAERVAQRLAEPGVDLAKEGSAAWTVMDGARLRDGVRIVAPRGAAVRRALCEAFRKTMTESR